MNLPANERCTWCGRPVEPEDGYRAAELPGDRRAVFCRLEHVVPWAMQGPRWEAGGADAPAVEDHSCAHCGEPLGEVRVIMVRHRGPHRIPDGFCSVDHLAAWAKSGGRWRGAQPDR
jgi:hypothetical protein